MDYIPKYFQPYELVPKATYERFEHSDYRIWWLFDPRVLYTADKLRKRFGKMAVNTWYWGGPSQYRGWRPWDCEVGAEFSQHKFGRALDLIPLETPLSAIQDRMIDGNYDYVSCIEIGEKVTWLHFDTRNYKGLLIITL